MKNLILLTLTLFSINSFATSPVQFSEEDSKAWNSSMDESSLEAIQNWVKKNQKAMGQFGGTNDGACSTLFTTQEVFMATHAYNYKGTYAVGLELTDGFAQISKAKMSNSGSTLYLMTSSPLETIICKAKKKKEAFSK